VGGGGGLREMRRWGEGGNLNGPVPGMQKLFRKDGGNFFQGTKKKKERVPGQK